MSCDVLGWGRARTVLFNFLLDIHNGKPQKAFFTKLEPGRTIRTVSTRDHKHTRPHRKGNQADNDKDNSNDSPLPPSVADDFGYVCLDKGKES